MCCNFRFRPANLPANNLCDMCRARVCTAAVPEYCPGAPGEDVINGLGHLTAHSMNCLCVQVLQAFYQRPTAFAPVASSNLPNVHQL